MNEIKPLPEYGYCFVAQNDLKPGDEHWNGNRWIICEAGCRGVQPTCGYKFRCRRILPPEGMRILGWEETVKAGRTFQWLRKNGNVWVSYFWGIDTTVKDIVNYVNGNTRRDAILAIAAMKERGE